MQHNYLTIAGKSRFSPILVSLLAAMLFAPVIGQMAGEAYDYVVHRDIAVTLMKSHVPSTPHFMLQVLTIAGHILTGITLDHAMAGVVLLSYAATAAIIAKVLMKGGAEPAFALFMTLSLLLVGPLTFLTPLDGHLYLGYIPTNVFHNPTILLLKPFALLSFSYALSAISGDRISSKAWLGCAAVSFSCALIKPSFTICILPSLILFAAYRWLRNEPCEYRQIILGFLLPSALVLGVQFWMTYSPNQIKGVYEGKSNIIFAPLAVMGTYSSWLLPKFLLSIAFPATVLATHFRAARKELAVQAVWLVFLLGAGCTYLLAESGPRMLQGNFGWSGQISLFLLFAYSMDFLVKEHSPLRLVAALKNPRFALCSAVFLLHVLCGVIFYVAEYSSSPRYW